MSLGVRYCVRVEEDNHYSGKFMVCIMERMNESGWENTVGIPIRDVTREMAIACQSPLRYAFEFGLREMQESMIKQMSLVANSVGVAP